MWHILRFYTVLRNISGKLVGTLLLMGMLTIQALPAQATPPNPRLVKDINPGLSSAYIQWEPTAVNGVIYFTAVDGAHGQELWRTDGTEAGTFLLADIHPGPYNSSFEPVAAINDTYFFKVYKVDEQELWKSDGTVAGTVLVKAFNGAITAWTTVNYTIFLIEYNGSDGFTLWKSDGTVGGIAFVKDYFTLDPDGYSNWQFTNVNGMLFFHADDGIHGDELWKSDGTEAGTVMVKDINPEPDGAGPGQLINLNGTLFFEADDGIHGRELWKSDGTEAGTVMVEDLDLNGMFDYINFNGRLFFNVFTGWYRSDGTTGGTVKVWDGLVETPREINGTLYFEGDDKWHGDELWKSDGTTAGTVMVKDIYPGAKSSLPYIWSDVNGTLFFSAVTKYGRELWRSDGTKAGTKLVRDIYPGAKSSEPQSLVNADGTLFFTAVNKDTTGRELWKSDGTRAGTVLVADIVPRGTDWAPRILVPMHNLLLFVTNDGAHGYEWWVLDLTKPITAMVGETILDTAADAEIPEESISDAEAEAVYQAELAAYEAGKAPAEDEAVTDEVTPQQKIFLPLISQ